MDAWGDARWAGRVELAAWVSVAAWVVGLPLVIVVTLVGSSGPVAFGGMYVVLAGCLAVVGGATLSLPERSLVGTVGAIASLAGVAAIALAIAAQLALGAGRPVWLVALVLLSLDGLLIVDRSRRELRRGRRGLGLLLALAWACVASGAAMDARVFGPALLALPLLPVWLLRLRRPPAPPGERFAAARRIGLRPGRVFLVTVGGFTAFGLVIDALGLLALVRGDPDTTAGDLGAVLAVIVGMGVFFGAIAAAVVGVIRGFWHPPAP